MTWKDGHVCVCHPREPWPEDYPPIFVHARLDALRGKTPDQKKQYEAAKLNFAMGCAEEVLARCISKQTMDAMIAHVIGTPGGLNARIIMPHPPFDDANGEDIRP